MDTLEAIILGLIQGIFEWLPVSSQGMASLVMINLFDTGFTEAVMIAIWLHLGTLIASVIYFRQEVIDIISKGIEIVKSPRGYSISREDLKLFNFLLLATLTTTIIGGIIYLSALKRMTIAGSIATVIIGMMLIITGLLLLKIKNTHKSKRMDLKDSLLVGALQGFAIIPGISRSGITTSGLLIKGYEPKKALTLSFLMSIPATTVAVTTMIVLEEFYFGASALIALAIALVFGLVTIKLLMKVAQKVNFGAFCIGFGILSIISGLLF